MSLDLSSKPVPFPLAHLRLPPFPQSALKVLQLARQDDVHFRQLAQIISADAAFASEVLIVSNSLRYARRYQVETIENAISVLGMKALHGICLTVGVRSYLARVLHNPVMSLLWKHNLATALIAELLASEGFMDKAVAYTSGMLHDIGRLGIAVVRPREYEDLLVHYHGSSAGLLREEKSLFGVDHCRFGEQLASEWKFPAEYIEHIVDHHCTDAAEPDWTMTQIIKISCQMADAAGFAAFSGCEAVAYEDVLRRVPEPERSHMPVTAEELSTAIARKIRAVQQS